MNDALILAIVTQIVCLILAMVANRYGSMLLGVVSFAIALLSLTEFTLVREAAPLALIFILANGILLLDQYDG